MPHNLLDFTPSQIESKLHLKKGGGYWSKFIYQAIFQQNCKTLETIPGLRPDILHKLKNCHLLFPKIINEQIDFEDSTVKWLFDLGDGTLVETVVMPFAERATVCISTQSGCSMGCKFCATGQLGLGRSLTAGEIVGQVMMAKNHLDGQGLALTNVVFMGMGEPFDNFDETMRAVEILSADIGLAIAPRRITISTVGLTSGIRELAAARCGCQLAVSLHSAIQSKRTAIMPVANGYPLAELLLACKEYNSLTKKRVFFEYAVFKGFNDGPDDLQALADFVNSLDGHVNLLAWNKVPGMEFEPVDRDYLLKIQSFLTAKGLRVLIRESRGNNIAAACGQLRAAR